MKHIISIAAVLALSAPAALAWGEDAYPPKAGSFMSPYVNTQVPLYQVVPDPDPHNAGRGDGLFFGERKAAHAADCYGAYGGAGCGKQHAAHAVDHGKVHAREGRVHPSYGKRPLGPHRAGYGSNCRPYVSADGYSSGCTPIPANYYNSW